MVATEVDKVEMYLINVIQTLIAEESSLRMLFMEEIIGENVHNDHVEEMDITPP